ncbi:MAG: HAD hydrolase-like protein, partial [Opitutaceae bacterium]|nr:HAD hydrolase-like protein [Opitutaceae bacterium]
SAGQISADEIRQIIHLGHDMLAHPVELLDGVADVVGPLAASHRLLLITKGDLRDQERKLSKSGLSLHFSHIEIVSEKDPTTYERILRRHGVAPQRFLMVGNSLKSDILPVLALGGTAAYVPYPITWGAEKVDALPKAEGRFFQLASVREVPELVQTLAST